MGKPRKTHRKRKFNFNKNRKRQWKKSKKLPKIECSQIQEEWDDKVSVERNLHRMGLSTDPNKTLRIPRPQDVITGQDVEVMDISEAKEFAKKSKVVRSLESEANRPQQRRVRLSQPDVRYCIYMIETYGEDYKAMARDDKNYYQDTPKQIRKKILTFKSIPEQYKAYLKSKEEGTLDMDDS